MAPKKRQRATPEAVVAVPAATTLTLKATSTSADRLRESLTDMWRSEILCDVEFTIEGRSFKAHRNIVAAESPYLNALVTNTTMKERSGPIELKEIAGNTFASALEFMYSHETTLASQDDLQPLLHAASLLRVPSLEAAVEAAIAERLEPSSALHALGLAEHLSLPVLAAAAKEIVLAHFEEAVAVEGDVLATLSAEKLGELIAADALLVRCVALPCAPCAPARLPPALSPALSPLSRPAAPSSHSDEWVVFEAIKAWLVQTPAPPAEAARRLLGHVRFPRLAKERQLQLETDELALQHTALIAKAYREELHGEDTPRTRARGRRELKFEDLKVGMWVQVMDDVEFVSKSCEETPPGAERGKRAGWNLEMANAIGRRFVVKSTDAKFMSAKLATEGENGMKRDYAFPYTVLCASPPAWCTACSASGFR